MAFRGSVLAAAVVLLVVVLAAGTRASEAVCAPLQCSCGDEHELTYLLLDSGCLSCKCAAVGLAKLAPGGVAGCAPLRLSECVCARNHEHEVAADDQGCLTCRCVARVGGGPLLSRSARAAGDGDGDAGPVGEQVTESPTAAPPSVGGKDDDLVVGGECSAPECPPCLVGVQERAWTLVAGCLACTCVGADRFHGSGEDDGSGGSGDGSGDGSSDDGSGSSGAGEFCAGQAPCECPAGRLREWVSDARGCPQCSCVEEPAQSGDGLCGAEVTLLYATYAPVDTDAVAECSRALSKSSHTLVVPVAAAAQLSMAGLTDALQRAGQRGCNGDPDAPLTFGAVREPSAGDNSFEQESSHGEGIASQSVLVMGVFVAMLLLIGLGTIVLGVHCLSPWLMGRGGEAGEGEEGEGEDEAAGTAEETTLASGESEGGADAQPAQLVELDVDHHMPPDTASSHSLRAEPAMVVDL